MHHICNYIIEVNEKVDEDAFNAMSPFQITVVRAEPATTLFAIETDQSGLIGLLRHLHQDGFVILSLSRE